MTLSDQMMFKNKSVWWAGSEAVAHQLPVRQGRVQLEESQILKISQIHILKANYDGMEKLYTERA